MIPQVLLTFANRSAGEPGHLRALPAERRAIEAALWDAVQSNLCAVQLEQEITRHGLINYLQTPTAVEHVVAFHYAGHASGSALALGRGQANADGVAAMLGRLPRLQLVFLNGCSTQAQVDALLAVGVRVVVATRVDVNDLVAKDFAAHFYARLGEGDPVRRAFQAAVDAVRTAHADPTAARAVSRGSIRVRSVKPAEPRTVPWGLHTAPARPGEADPLDWSLPLAADDPLFVLPRPVSAMPETPFRGAEAYRVEDAAAFLGRGHEIRTVYDALMAQTPVVLHGPRGAGRTSLIRAGLQARLHASRVAVVTSEAFAVEGELDVLLIDDADGLTDEQVAQALRAAPAVLFAVQSQGRARMEAAVAGAGAQAASIALPHLDEPAIRRVLDGTARLFAFEYTPDLPARLAVDLVGRGATRIVAPAPSPALLEIAETGAYGAPQVPQRPKTQTGPEGATTPIVSAVMTELWAGRTDETISDAQYEKYRSDGCLDSLVGAGLAALAAQVPEWVESGFALDVLAHHATLLGTAQGHSLAALRARYSHRDDLLDFIDAACAKWLLVRTEDGTALGHDLIAPLIGSRFATSRAPAQQARRIIEERLPVWEGGADGVTLDAADLAAVRAGRASMPALDEAGTRLIEASDVAVRSRTRRTRGAKIALVTAAAAIIALAFVWQQQRGKAKLAAAEAAQLVQARALSIGLVEAYRALEDPDPARAGQGVARLGRLVERHPTLAPDVARLALRAWSMAVTPVEGAADRLARPAVSVRGGVASLIDRRGRFHTLDGAPTGWFVLPGDRFVGLLDTRAETLTLRDANTGAAGATFPVPGTIEHIGVFDAPGLLLVLSNYRASEPLWHLTVIDTQGGRGQAASFEDSAWSGHCVDDVPLLRSPSGEDRVRLAFGADDRLVAATIPPEARRPVRFEECLKGAIAVLPPRTAGVVDLEPAWRRWTASNLDAAGRRDGLLGGPGEMPSALVNQRAEEPEPDGCIPGCGFVDPGGPVFNVGALALHIDRNICDTMGGSDWLTRWCRTDGRSGYMWEPDDIRGLDLDERPAPRRRGDLLLYAGRILRLSDLVPLKTAYAGVAWDFALSPDDAQLALLTDRGLLHLARVDGEYRERRLTRIDGDPFLAVTWADADTLIVQRRSGVTAMRVRDDAIQWRRQARAVLGGLAAGAGMVAIRADDAVRLVAATDGTPLSPIERPGFSAKAPIAMRIDPDGAVTLQDGARRLRRAALPERPRPSPGMSVDAWLQANPSRIKEIAPGAPCVAGRALHGGECWPDGAGPDGAWPVEPEVQPGD